jgi:hypothetical protein
MRRVWSCLAVIGCVAGCSNSSSNNNNPTEDGGAGTAFVGTWACTAPGQTPSSWTFVILENTDGTLAVMGGSGGDAGTCTASADNGEWEVTGTTATPGTITCTQTGGGTTTVSPITLAVSGDTLTFSETVTLPSDAGLIVTATCTKSP